MAKGIAKSFGFSRQVTKPVGGRRSPGHFCRFLRGTMCVSSRFCGRWLSVSLRGVRRVAAFLRIEDLRLADARLLLSLFALVVCVWLFVTIANHVTGGSAQPIDERLMRALRVSGDPSQPVGPSWLPGAVRDITALGPLRASVQRENDTLVREVLEDAIDRLEQSQLDHHGPGPKPGVVTG